MSLLECLEHDLPIVSSIVERDLAQLRPASEIDPAEEGTLEEIVWAGFQESVEAGCLTMEQASTEFYVWRSLRLGHPVASQLLEVLPAAN